MPYVDPTWSEWYQHGPYIVSMFSYVVSTLSLHVLRAPYMVPTWYCADWYLPGPYMVAT